MTRIVALGVLLAALLPTPAEGAQRRLLVVYDTDLTVANLEALADRGAIGLLVPDAGPRTSGARALAALERGAVRNSLLGGGQSGRRLLHALHNSASRPGGVPFVLVGLPEGGPQPNDRRYPIAVVAPGWRGILTSRSTRIPGLVSIVDVAPTSLGLEPRLGWTADDDALLTLSELDRRIDRHREAKTPYLFLSLALIGLMAAFWRRGALPAVAAVLLGNLVLGMTDPTYAWTFLVFLLVAAGAALFALRPVLEHGFLMVGVLAVYLASLGIDERWVALSPLGPTQNGRFYGLSNLLATLLLVPALAGAAILGRRFGIWAFAAVAGLSLVTVGGSQFGADGGGAVVLLVGFGVLVVLEGWLSRQVVLVGAAMVAVLAIALAAGGSHVTDAIADGPAGLAEDLGRRLELSWLRATDGWAVALLVFGGIAVLAAAALRERRALPVAYLAAIGVSLIVNDSPNDVVVAGLAGYLALSTAPGVARPAGERATPAAPEPRARTAPAASP